MYKKMLTRIVVLLSLFSYSHTLSRILTPENFDDTITTKSAFVFFFDEDHTFDAIREEWNALGSRYYYSPDIMIGSMNCSSYRELCNTFGVEKFPTFLYFPNGHQPIVYDFEQYERQAFFEFMDSIHPFCDVSDLGTCNDQEKTIIKELRTYPSRKSSGIKKWNSAIIKIIQERNKNITRMDEEKKLMYATSIKRIVLYKRFIRLANDIQQNHDEL